MAAQLDAYRPAAARRRRRFELSQDLAHPGLRFARVERGGITDRLRALRPRSLEVADGGRVALRRAFRPAIRSRWAGDQAHDKQSRRTRRDENAESRALLQKIIEENGIDDLLIALADCLTVDLPNGINADVIRSHLNTYAES